jgi:DNA-binding NtrC family response regulator
VTEPSTLTGEDPADSAVLGEGPELLGLAIAWSASEPGRAGEVCTVPPTRGAPFIMGRGDLCPDGEELRLNFVRERGDTFDPRPPLASRRISRRQLRIRAHGTQSLTVENIGRCPLLHNGVRVNSAMVEPGHTLQLGQELLLLCVLRQAWMRPSRAAPALVFGLPDAHGIVGESPAIWELRRQIAFLAPRDEHVLIVGESGTGKELAARAVHALSSRSHMPLVARNAATFPDGLVDAELFGHTRDYPSAGMPKREGVVGQATGGTLFLDELGELPAALQPHLLRVLDSGQYHRLGDSTVRVSDFRLIGATNQPNALRPDLAARLKLRLHLPGLDERREDIPLLAAHMLRSIARRNSDIAERIFPGGDVEGTEPRMALALVDTLLRRAYRTHVRELEAFLWEALAAAPEQVLGIPRRTSPSLDPVGPNAPPRAATPQQFSAEAIEVALAENEGSIERTWRALGLGNRHVLARLIAKHGVRRKEGV